MKTLALYIASVKLYARMGISAFGCAVFLLVSLAPWTSAFADAPVTKTQYQIGNDYRDTLQELCDIGLTNNEWGNMSNAAYRVSRVETKVQSTFPQWSCQFYVIKISTGVEQFDRGISVSRVTRTLCADGSNPDTSKPLEQQCGTPAPQCPAAGTAAGTHNFTVGWSYSPTAGSSMIAPPSFPSGTVSIGGCLATVGSVQECYRSPQPSAQGLYRLSCDYDLTHTGDSGAPSTSTPDPNAPEPAPNCPGTSGTVNGVAVCLESGTPTPPTFPTPPVVGNPIPGNPNAPGTSPDPSSFDPTTGAGSSSAPGSPGSGGGSGGTGGTTVPSTGGGDSGEGENTGPKECGTPGRPKCQIDETGTPDGTGTEITDEQVNQYVADRTEQMEKKQEGWDFGWTLDLPQGACQPWTVGARGLSMTFDWCPYLEQMRALLGWFYMMITAVAIYGSFRSAGVFNKG